jgi:hypothetical protein
LWFVSVDVIWDDYYWHMCCFFFQWVQLLSSEPWALLSDCQRSLSRTIQSIVLFLFWYFFTQ